MAIIKKFAPFQNLTNYQTFLIDTNPNSSYFRITEFKDTFTGGKNGFLIEGSQYLRETTEVKIEILDVEGNPIYFEPGEGVPEYYEGLSKLVSVHVYDDTPIGLGKITILGELKEYVDGNGVTRPIPDDWKGVYNVKWEKEFKINKNLVNEDIVRFYKRPLIQIEELVKPIFSKSIPTATDTVEVTGIPQNPPNDTDLSNWRAGTNYKLIRATGSWDRDVDENQITISSLNYSPTIIEVLNDREVLVDIPYTENNLVKAFLSQSATVTYSDFQNEIIGETSLTGSFAKIDMYQLKTFVGDVARVKIFRKSRNTAGDFQFVQESKLESTELLRDVTTQSDNEISYGRFTETNLSNYWITESNDHPTTIDSSLLSQAVKVDYNTGLGGVQKLITSESFSLSKDVEYTLSFRTLLNGTETSDKYIKAYFSGSYTNNLGNPASYVQSFMHISGSGVYSTRQNVSQNILAERDINAKLVLEFKGDDWYVSNVSLRNAQETSFSPDEFTLIQDIPRKIAAETFDFRFEFYDINNNYIPIDVTAFKTFTGGNDFPSSGKILTFESDRNAFRFSTGSIANPYNQTIQFKTTAQNLTGSILFESQAFDVEGNYLSPSNYSQYPGLLTNVTTAGGLLTLNNFTGSYSGAGTAPYIGSIVYTASLENLQEFETVYRIEDGDNAPSLIVTSNANQFIYEPTALEPKPSGQSITIRAQRKNLASLITPITVNKSDSNAPNLTVGSTTNGVTTYTISALEFSSSFAANNFDEVTYSFTGSDVFGNQQTDEITLSKVINFDGVSVVLSTENTSFESDSTGTVTASEFDKGDGSVDVRVGSKVISHSEGLGSKNTFDIVSVTPSTGLTANSLTPTTNSYGISAMTVDSGTLALLLRYKAGDNSTTIDFNKVVNYSKTKKAAPVLSIETTNKDQSVTAKSTGEQVDSFVNATVTVKEQYGGSTTTKTITSLTATSGDISNISTTPSTGLITLNGKTLANGTNNTTITVSATVTDSEGTSRTLTDTISLSKVKKSAPVVNASINPQSQTVESNVAFTSVGTPQDITLVVNEGGSNYTYTTNTTLAEEEFQITLVSIGKGTNNDDGTITPTTPTDDTGTSGTITYKYKNSEGTEFTNKTIDFSVGVAIQGDKGDKGDPGDPGSNAFSIELNPPSQEVIVDVTGSITNPDTFVVQVFDSQGSYTYDDVSPYGDGTFYIDNLTQTNHSGTVSNTTGTITPVVPDDANGSNVTFDVYVTDRDGTTSDAVSKSHKIRVIAEGSTGPGIVFTGVWDTDRIYQFDLQNGRRDAVLWSTDGNPPYDAYYATLQQAPADIDSPDITTGSYWEYLGEEDFFVAAKIAIFEQSFIKETLNIGTSENNGSPLSSANITLNGGDTYPYFSLGQSNTTGTQQYGVNGIFIGRHDSNKNTNASNGAYVLSLVNGTTSYMKWNGSTLDIKGAITATTISATVGNIAGFTLKDGAFYTGTKSTLASNVAGVYLGTDGIALGTNSPFKVTSGGVLTASTATISGTVNANAGTFSNDITIGGTLTANDMVFGIGVNATQTKNGIQLSGGDYWYDDGTFSLGAGDITYDGATLNIAGVIQIGDPIDDGSIGGWNVDADYIWTGTKQITDGAYSTSGITLADTGAIRAENFRIDVDGSAYFKGQITATSGYIGDAASGFEISSSYFRKGTKSSYNGAGTGVYVGADGIGLGTAFTVSAAGALTATGGNFSGNITGTTITGGIIRGSNISVPTTSPKFTVNSQGILYAQDAILSGSVSADTGDIGGWIIGNGKIQTTEMSLNSLRPALEIFDGSSLAVDINTNTTLTSLTPITSPSIAAADNTSLSSDDIDTVLYPGNSTSFTLAATADSIIDSNNTINMSSAGFTSGDSITFSFESLTTTGVNLAKVDYTFINELGTGSTLSWSGGLAASVTTTLYLKTSSGTVIPGASLVRSGTGFGGFQGQTNSGTISSVNTNISSAPLSTTFTYDGTYTSVEVWSKTVVSFPVTLSASAGTGTWEIIMDLYIQAPDYTIVKLSKEISKTEIAAGGLQVASNSTNYVRMVRDANSSGTDTMLVVGGSIEATGNITANASDIRLKDIKSKIENPLSKLKKLNGIIYTWNELANQLVDYDTEEEQIGLVAQEVHEILPQITKIAPFDSDGKGNSKSGQNYLTIQYERVVPLLVESIKELSEKVEKLEEENKRLRDGNS